MPTVITKGGKPVVLAEITAEKLRDLLLSLPENERMFVTSSPEAGKHRVYNIHGRKVGDKYQPVIVYETVPE